MSPRSRRPSPVALALLLACDAAPDDAPGDAEARAGAVEPEPDDPLYYSAPSPDATPAVDCAEKKDTGYVQGDPFEITVVTVDGKPVELETANAYIQMQKAAAKDGVGIQIVSGFRTMAEQQYLYNCYVNCNCNNCNLAAKPGYSNHQSGHALDLNTGNAAVNSWLKAHAGAWGFKATVPSESWHYEWWGGGPPADGPCGVPAFDAELVDQAFPGLDEPPILLQVGETRSGSFKLRNLGKTTWTATTFLGTLPKGEPSPLADEGWPATIRAARVDAKTPQGEVGRFDVTIRGNTPGDFIQEFKLVDEGEDKVTWFLKEPLALHVLVVDAPADPPTFGTTGDDDTTTGGAGEGSHGDGTTGDGSTSTAGASGDASSSSSSSSGGEGTTGAGVDAATNGHDDGQASDGCACRQGPGGAAGGPLAALALVALRRRRRP